MITTPATPSIAARQYLNDFLGDGGMSIVMDWKTQMYLLGRADDPCRETWSTVDGSEDKILPNCRGRGEACRIGFVSGDAAAAMRRSGESGERGRVCCGDAGPGQ